MEGAEKPAETSKEFHVGSFQDEEISHLSDTDESLSTLRDSHISTKPTTTEPEIEAESIKVVEDPAKTPFAQKTKAFVDKYLNVKNLRPKRSIAAEKNQKQIDAYTKEFTAKSKLSAKAKTILSQIIPKVLSKAHKETAQTIYGGGKTSKIKITDSIHASLLKFDIDGYQKKIDAIKELKTSIHESTDKMNILENKEVQLQSELKTLPQNIKNASEYHEKLESLVDDLARVKNELQDLREKNKIDTEKLNGLESEGFYLTRSLISFALDEEKSAVLGVDLTEMVDGELVARRRDDISNALAEKPIEEILGELVKLKSEATERITFERKKANFKAIGGVNVKIKTTDRQATVDTTHFTAQNFTEKINEAGGKKVQMNAGGKSFNALHFPRNTDNETAFEKTLDTLGLYSAGWKQIPGTDNEVYIVSEEDYNLYNSIDSKSDITYTEPTSIVTPEDGGTVIWTPGNEGRYEMYNKEILNYLMRGIDVIGTNFRGFGDSEGAPSNEGYNNDLESVYQYLKENNPQLEDKRILMKALCLSGGPVTHLAKNHPNINLLLDQTYADYQQLVAKHTEMVIEEIEEFLTLSTEEETLEGETTITEQTSKPSKIKLELSNWLKKYRPFLAQAFSKLLVPSWKVAEDLKGVKGEVGMIYVTDDTIISAEMGYKKNMESLQNSKEGSNLSTYEMSGRHAQSWVTQETRTIETDFSYPQRKELLQAIDNLDVKHEGNLLDFNFVNETSSEISSSIERELDEYGINLSEVGQDGTVDGETYDKVKLVLDTLRAGYAKNNDPQYKAVADAFINKLFNPLIESKEVIHHQGRDNVDNFLTKIGFNNPLI